MSVGRAGPGQADGRSSSFTTHSLPLAGAETGRRIAVMSVTDRHDPVLTLSAALRPAPSPPGSPRTSSSSSSCGRRQSHSVTLLRSSDLTPSLCPSALILSSAASIRQPRETCGGAPAPPVAPLLMCAGLTASPLTPAEAAGRQLPTQ